MSDAAKTRRRDPRDPGIGPHPVERLALDARHPLALDDAGLVLLVTAGTVDLFAQPHADGRPAGKRTHLFRVEQGGVILGLPAAPGEGAGQMIAVIAVGGQGTEAAVLDRRQVADAALVEGWIERLAGALGGGPVAHHVGPGEAAELAAGDRLSGTRGVVWLQVERGAVHLGGGEAAWRAEDGPLPVAQDLWAEAATETSVVARSGDELAALDLWRGLDGFHREAMAIIARRVGDARVAEGARLDRRIALAGVQSDRMLRDLGRIVLPDRGARAPDRDAADPLFAACQIVGDALGVTVRRPLHRRADQGGFGDLAEIARISRLRMRRILLRADWWRRDIGPLVAWQGEEHRPVAVVPIAPGRQVIVEPASGVRRPLDEASAGALAPEAATLYATLPSATVAAIDLFRLCAAQIGGDMRRVLVSALALAVLALAPPVVIAVLVDAVIPRSDLGQLGLCAAALALTAIGTAGFQAAQGIAMLRLSGRVDWQLQAAVVDRLLRLPVSFFRNYTAGDLADRVLGIQAMRQVLTGRAMGGLLAGVLCLFNFVLMFLYEPALAFVAVAVGLVQISTIVLIALARLRHERRHFDLQGAAQGLVLQFLTGIGKLRVAAATTRALANWASAFRRQKTHFIASRRAANLQVALDATLPTIAALLVFALAAPQMGAPGGLDAGRFLGFFAAFGQALAAIASLGAAIGETLVAIPQFARLRPILAQPSEVAEARESPGTISGGFEFSQVTFRYNQSGPPVLDRLSLRVDRGQYVAIVGPSGSGKSTIFRLLLGFELAESGSILFDGKAIDTLDIAAVRRQVGVVLQNGKLLSGSIYENICGAVQVPIDQAWEAARLAGLESDIEAMPMGLHTVITEGMNTLSGGQRQRLMIARALVHRPRMLLFDEATSALDNRTQSIVSAALAKLNVTRVVIAHRLSTVQDADRIVVLANGTIAQTGSFAELSGASGLFAELAKRQLL